MVVRCDKTTAICLASAGLACLITFTNLVFIMKDGYFQIKSTTANTKCLNNYIGTKTTSENHIYQQMGFVFYGTHQGVII